MARGKRSGDKKPPHHDHLALCEPVDWGTKTYRGPRSETLFCRPFHPARDVELWGSESARNARTNPTAELQLVFIRWKAATEAGGPVGVPCLYRQQ